MTWITGVELALFAVAAIVVPLVVLYAGLRIAAALREREVKARYVALAIDILSEVPDAEHQDDEQLALRTWATQVLATHSEVGLPASTRQALAERMPLVHPEIPFSVRVEDESGRPVPGAQVQMIEFAERYRTVRSAGWTGRSGEAVFAHLRGSWVPYMISVRADGYRHFLSEVAPLSRHHGRILVLQREGERARPAPREGVAGPEAGAEPAPPGMTNPPPSPSGAGD